MCAPSDRRRWPPVLTHVRNPMQDPAPILIARGAGF